MIENPSEATTRDPLRDSWHCGTGQVAARTDYVGKATSRRIHCGADRALGAALYIYGRLARGKKVQGPDVAVIVVTSSLSVVDLRGDGRIWGSSSIV